MFRYVEYTKTKREFDIALPSGGGMGGRGLMTSRNHTVG